MQEDKKTCKSEKKRFFSFRKQYIFSSQFEEFSKIIINTNIRERPSASTGRVLEFRETRVTPRARTRYLNEYDFKSLQSVNMHVYIPRTTNTIIPTASANDKREKISSNNAGMKARSQHLRMLYTRACTSISLNEMKNVSNIVEIRTHSLRTLVYSRIRRQECREGCNVV